MKGTGEGQLRIDIRRVFEQLKESLFSDIIYVVKIASANKSIYTEESFSLITGCLLKQSSYILIVSQKLSEKKDCVPINTQQR